MNTIKYNYLRKTTIYLMTQLAHRGFTIFYYKYDIPLEAIGNISADNISVDTETLGLNTSRDRLCLLQVKIDAIIYLIHFPTAEYSKSPNIKRLLSNDALKKLMHYAYFDVDVVFRNLNVLMKNIWCTRTASRMIKTYSESGHGLKSLCKKELKITINKKEQCSNWSSETLSLQQIHYAAADVMYLGCLYDTFLPRLIKEKRIIPFESMMELLPSSIVVTNNHFSVLDLLNHTSVRAA